MEAPIKIGKKHPIWYVFSVIYRLNHGENEVTVEGAGRKIWVLMRVRDLLLKLRYDCSPLETFSAPNPIIAGAQIMGVRFRVRHPRDKFINNRI